MFPPHISWSWGFFCFFLVSSVAQLEAEISTYFLKGGGYIWPPGIPVLIEIWVSNSYWHTWPQLLITLWKFCVAHSFSFWFIIKNVCAAFARKIRPHLKCLENENNKMCHKSKSYDLRMVKMVLKVAPWLPFNIGKVKSEGPILTGKCINLATGLSQKGRTYFSDPPKQSKEVSPLWLFCLIIKGSNYINCSQK